MTWVLFWESASDRQTQCCHFCDLGTVLGKHVRQKHCCHFCDLGTVWGKRVRQTERQTQCCHFSALGAACHQLHHKRHNGPTAQHSTAQLISSKSVREMSQQLHGRNVRQRSQPRLENWATHWLIPPVPRTRKNHGFKLGDYAVLDS